MVTTIWGISAASDYTIEPANGDMFNPSVADSGGGSFGVAWTSAQGVTVRFYDVTGSVDPALGTIALTTSSTATHVALAAGGAVGYGATWEDGGALFGRYVGLSGTVGGVFAIDAVAGVAQHDAVMGGYAIDGANGKPAIDGFNVVWVATSTVDAGEGLNGDGLTAAQVAQGYGRIMLQRFAVPLDSKVDPLGPPVAAGLDGIATNDPANGLANTDANAAANVGNAIGRDPATVVTHDGETVVTWIDTANQVHLRVFGLNGASLDAGVAIPGGTIDDLDGALGTGVTAGGSVKVADLAGSGFVVAWMANIGGVDTIVGRVFAPGAIAGTYAAGPTIALHSFAAGTSGDFSLGTLPDTGGFSVSWSELAGPGDHDIRVQSFNAAGGTDGLATTIHTSAAGDQTGVALAGLIGDRIVAVYQDDPSAAAGDQSIRASILDTRTLPDGSAIVLGGAGLTISGDVGGNGTPKAIADQLVGTIGNDTLNGLGNTDELYGALGDDTLSGGSGNDILDGGGNGIVGDTAVFSGNQADYTIAHLGADLFSVTDNRGGTPDGADTVRGVENLRFADGTITTAAIIAGASPVTPAAWGWTNSDGDVAPDLSGAPDVDGFLVNHAAAGAGPIDTNAYVADSVGEFIGVVWETAAAPGAATHISGQFYDVIGAPDAFIPNVMAISDGIGIETNAVIVSGGANSGWGVAWEQIDTAADTSREIRTNFVGPGQLTSVELSVSNEGSTVDQHDAAMSGSFLDRTLADPVGGSALPRAMNEGYNVAWVSTHLDGADGVLPADYGRIMLQRFEVPLDALGNPGAPVAGGIDGIAGLNNAYNTGDAAVWIGDEAAAGAGGAIGRDPSTAALHGFETAVIWIEQDGAGGERVAGQAYDDLGQVIAIPGFDDISGAFGVAAGTTAHIVSAGAVNFGIVWVTADNTSPSGLSVVGTMYSPTGAGLNGTGFGFGAPAPAKLFALPAGANVADLQLTVSGISGEDSADLIVGWKAMSAGTADMMAQHINVALDPVTGFAIALAPEGNAITVNAETAGNQDGGTIAGMLGDRFIAVYHDDNGAYTDGNDIVARVIDTRDAAAPDPIIGDLVRAGLPQARRDVLIGTNGDDTIRGDISDSDGRVDYIYAGMGDDTIEGGPGVRGAAGIPEIIDGGEGSDTAVYTGRLQDYSITINGDGSYEVIDLRPIADAAGNLLQNDGIDNLYSIEHLQFLDTAHAGAAAQTIDLEFPGTPPAPPAGYDGTPVAWSIDDTSPNKEIAVDVAGGGPAKSGINVINLQDGAGLTWISGTNEVWAISYDTTGKADPILLGANTQLTDGSFSTNTVADLDVAMTGGLGMTAVWESTDGTGDTSIHLRFASTNTHVVADPAGGVPGPGLAVDALTGAAGEIIVVGSNGAGTAIDPVIQGYEIVDINNDTLEVGFHVGFVLENDAALDALPGDIYGALMLVRYEIPVYDIFVDAAGLPILDGTGQGQLARDANGNLVPSTVTTFGTGSETAPVSIGLDGLRGTVDDNQAIVLTTMGLFAANAALPPGATILQGRDISIGSLHDGQLVVSYIGTDEQVHLKILVASVDQAGDRELNAGAPDGLGSPTDIVATGITTYSELAIPFATTLGSVAAGQTAFVVPQQNGSFGVFWAAPNGPAADIQGIIFSGAGTNWSPSPTITFATGLPAGVSFQVAPTGVTPGGLEDGFFVSWESGSGILGQRFDMVGVAVGIQIVVGDPTSGTPGLHATAGIDDGRMIVGYVDGTDVSAQFLDNREPGIAIIGPRTGAPRDVLVGTVGDDAMDGRALGDELHGGLGNDLITMGSGADIGFGGDGDDTIIGGTGQDQLLGEAGDDVLWGGLSGPADPQVDRDLQTGLVAAGVSAALIASDPGADIISGGAGIDTLSYQGEFGRFNVDLGTGLVTSDRNGDGTFVLEDVIGQIGDDGAGGTIFTFIDDVENVTASFGDDIITGNAGDNIIDGGLGNNVIDGAGGNDTVVIHGSFEEYAISYDAATNAFTFIDADHTEIVRNTETFVFEGGVTKTAADLLPGPVAADDVATMAEDGTVTIDVLGNDANAIGAHITAVNGTAITLGQSIGVANGAITLTSSAAGADNLVFSPGANYFGPAAFTYTVTDASGHFSTASVGVTVTNTEDAPTDLVFNGNATTSSVAVNENVASGTVVGKLSTVDLDNTTVGTNDTFTYTLANTFGGAFQIVDDEIRVANGTLLDYESPTKTYALAVTTNDGHGGTRSENLAVNLLNVNEAPSDIIFGGNPATTSVNVSEKGDVATTLSATDPEGGALTFALTSSADGRFAISGNQIVVANPALIDFENPAGHSYTVEVAARDSSGLIRKETLTINATDAAETAVNGGNNDDTLNGAANRDDIINGGAGKDTMAGNTGDDTYFVDNSGDKVNENAGAGSDTVYVSNITSWTLGANTENLIYTGSANSTSWRGNALDNTIGGGSGNDQLQGDAGNDHLVGNAGNDSLAGGDGIDRLYGGAGNDTLDGGNGDDFLFGGAGNDTFNTSNGNDRIVLAAAFGIDQITGFDWDAIGGQDLIDVSSYGYSAASIGSAIVISGTAGQTTVTIGGDSLTLVGVNVANVDAQDFIFA